MSNVDPLIIIGKYAIFIAIAAAIASVGANIIVMLGFPILPSLLLNVMMLHLGVSAFMGRIPIIWLVLPAVAYLGWAVAVVQNRAQTDRTIMGLGLESRIDPSVALGADLLFAQNDYFAASVRRYLVGGRVFEGAEELQVFGSHDTNDFTKAECNSPKYHQFGRRSGGILLKSWTIIMNDCTFSRVEQPPLSGLVFTRSEDQSPGGGPAIRYARYDIEDKSADGAVRRVGQFVFGTTRVWSVIPIVSIGCNSSPDLHTKNVVRWCWSEPIYDKYIFAFAGDRKLVSSAVNMTDPSDLAAVRALAELLGRAWRTSPPQL